MGEVEFLLGTGVGGGATVKRGRARLKFSTKHRPASPPSSGRPDCAPDFINARQNSQKIQTGLRLEIHFFSKDTGSKVGGWVGVIQTGAGMKNHLKNLQKIQTQNTLFLRHWIKS